MGQGSPQLLNYPAGCGMTGDIEVQNAPAAVFDHEEAVKQPKSSRWRGEEVKRDGDLAMIL